MLKTIKSYKNTIIICIFGIIGSLSQLLVEYLLTNKGEKSVGFFEMYAFVIAYYIIFRIALVIIHSILCLLKITKYEPESCSYIKDEFEKKLREKWNIQYQKQMDRYKARICYMVIWILFWFIASLVSGHGIFTALFMTFVFGILPFLIVVAPLPPEEYTGSSSSDGIRGSISNTKANIQRKIYATTWRFGKNYSETTFRDENGKKVGTSSTLKWTDGYSETTIKDKDGNKTGSIDHFKF